MVADNPTGFDDATLCRLVEESLGMLGRLKPGLKSIRVKSVRIDDTVILVDFYADGRDIWSVKAEMAAVTGALHGLLGTNELSQRPLLHYGMRAWENDDSWLMYAFCSADGARKMGEGKALDWLRETEFQENTADWRLARAKSLTSRAEIGLRDAIDHVLGQAEGTSWWSTVMTGSLDRIKVEAERQARRDGVATPSPRHLLNYTYLKDLSQLITNSWHHFSALWASQDVFADRMDRLNVLRRTEAHNRPIERQELEELESVHDEILDGIAKVHPQVVPAYLVEKWRLDLTRVAEKLRDSWGPEEVRRDIGENKARLSEFQQAADTALSDLERMSVPPGKDQLHQQLVAAVRLAAESSRRMLTAVDKPDIDMLEAAAGEFAIAMRGIREFEEAFLLSYQQ